MKSKTVFTHILAATIAAGSTYGLIRLNSIRHSRQEHAALFPVKWHTPVQLGIYALSSVKQADIVMLGDSLTEKFPWREITGCSNLINRGIGGETSDDVLARVATINALHPKIVFLTIGTNDAKLNIPFNETLWNIGAITKALSPAKVQVTLPPAIYGEAQSTIAALYYAQNRETPLFDANDSEDGVHLTAKGYLPWLKSIQPELDKYCQR